MLKSHALSAVVAVVLVSSGCASMEGATTGKSTLERIKASKTITMGYRRTSIPFSLEDSAGKPIGYSIDLCNRVVEDLRKDLAMPDLAVKWVPVTVENRIAAVRDGTVDLECGSTTNTLSRQAQVDFSLTTFVTGGSLLAMRETTKALTDLKGLRIAVIPGTTTERVLKDAIKDAPGQVQLIPVKDHAEGRAAIENKTADAYASDRDILIGLALTASDPRRFALGDRYFSYEPYALMLRRGDVDFRLAVNRSLARLYRSGDVLVIYQRWFESVGGPTALLLATYAIEGLPE
jgi:glutamate/aspartate transport system substrate-binding protein